MFKPMAWLAFRSLRPLEDLGAGGLSPQQVALSVTVADRTSAWAPPTPLDAAKTVDSRVPCSSDPGPEYALDANTPGAQKQTVLMSTLETRPAQH